MLPLDALVQSIGTFKNWSHAEKIMLFAWYSQSQPNKGRFNSADVRKCYQDLRLEEPSSISPFLNAMASSKPKKALKKSPGLYCLERSISDQYDARYLQRPATVYVHKLLADPPTKLHDATEQAYMDEAIVCFRNGAFRAAVVMTWNVAYDHLCQYVLTHRLSDFNAQLPLTYPKADIKSISRRDDFTELKESQVLQVCRSSNIISGSVHSVAKEKLVRRNIAAHPSGVSTLPETAEEFIKDIIENFVLKVGHL